jgi:hypothetical protein
VALAGINPHFEHEAVLVAIDQYLLDLLQVATFLAFFPELLSRPAEVRGIAGLNRQIECRSIHIRNHQDLACLCVLGYGRYQAVVIKSWSKLQTFFDILLCSHLSGLRLTIDN